MEHPLVTSNTIGMMDCAMYNGAFSRMNSCVIKFCRGLAFIIISSAENKITNAHMFIMAYVVSVHDLTSAFAKSVVVCLCIVFWIGICFCLLACPMTIPMSMDDMT